MSGPAFQLALLLPAALALWACSRAPDFVAKDEPWRADEERACLGAGLVRESAFVEARASLGGPSVCGALRPFAVAAAARGSVQLRPPALLRCPMVPAVDHWVERVVSPAARHYFGAPVVELKVAASYSCRPMNHVSGARLSEHGHANAVDISAFVLADGRVVHGQDRLVGRNGRAHLPARGASAAPATSSPPCWARATTPITATTSISTSPATAATARAGSASSPPTLADVAARSTMAAPPRSN